MKGIVFDGIIGQKKMPLPWSNEVETSLKRRWGADFSRCLPALWTDVGSKEHIAQIRMSYMDCVTDIMQHAFGEQIGAWCREHQVEYIGHIIEDNNASTRLGSSMGHYFRALWGQDMAGIDVIGSQLTVGGGNAGHASILGSITDGEFFHAVLGKLGSSLAHIDPKKRGRCVCEAFGAYGWTEGTRLMKYIADHLLVRGVTHFVPHAFSAKDFPDPDCPPHFYADGEDPLFPAFGQLMSYINRVSHLMSGGVHKASVALLYHAEAEWSGGDYMLMQKPARILAENHLDFDILPADVFRNMDQFRASFDGTLQVNGETYDALVLPASQYQANETIAFLNQAAMSGYPVLCIGEAPCDAVGVEIVDLEGLAAAIISKGIWDVRMDRRASHVRFYHVQSEGMELYLFSNESASESFSDEVLVSARGHAFLYDGMQNRLFHASAVAQDGGTAVRLELRPTESVVLVVTKEALPAEEMPLRSQRAVTLQNTWTVSFTSAKDYPAFAGHEQMKVLENISLRHPEFSGIIRYETTFSGVQGRALLHLEDAYETASVWCNGQFAGTAICPPYEFDVTGLLHDGENHLRIEVATTLFNHVMAVTGGQDLFSRIPVVIPPSGLMGSVTLYSET